jgi:short subunit dehydrogenase-like uncharacterized protein
MPADRQFDLVLFGATGFTGGLTAHYLAANGPDGLRWALVGRNRNKLEAVRASLEAELAAGVPAPELLVADAADPVALAKVAEAARVVVTTVGPYALYGEPLVAACAAAGSDYVDLTGEPEFVDRMWLGYHRKAEESGARLVHCCGFDSIPHDLGAYFTVKHLPEGVPLSVNGYVQMGAEFSGGTFASAINGFGRARQTLSAAKQRRQAEQRPAGRKIHSAPARPHRDADLGGWVVPMPTIDGPVVRRSAAALERYGPDFSYGHNVVAKHGRRDRRRGRDRIGPGAAAADAQALAQDPAITGRGPERGGPRQELVQGHLRWRGRRQARGHRGQRGRPRLQRDLEDAGRVGPLSRFRRSAADGGSGDHRRGNGRCPAVTPAGRGPRFSPARAGPGLGVSRR